MRCLRFHWIAVFFLLAFAGCQGTQRPPAAEAKAAKAPVAGEALFPDIELPLPESADHQAYLGLSGGGSFVISEIEADAVVIEILSATCTHCRKEAPQVNELYRLIQGDPRAGARLKLIGIGAGNDKGDLDYYSQRYEVPFPLFPDPGLEIHRRLGGPGTPFFVVVRMDPDGNNRIVHRHLGEIGPAAQFLNTILKRAGLDD